jgi:ribonucleoside-diphosphate reductase beta chain
MKSGKKKIVFLVQDRKDYMTDLKQKKIFDEFGSDSVQDRNIINGNSTGIFNLNSVKYQWAPKLYKIMVNNFWIPEKVSLVDDKVTIKELTNDELEAFKNTLSFLIALDSMQVANLPNIADYITAPEISGLFTIQAFQELIHSQSYQYLLQELFPNIDREEIYNYWRTNPLLLKRNKFIAGQYQKFIDNRSIETLKSAIAADYALEGIYFYNGFQFFYQLASRNKTANVAKMIKYIENDEVTHVNMFANIIREMFDLTIESDRNILIENITQAVEQEIEWGIEIYGDRILGISTESTENYIKYLANQRSKILGLGVIYKGYTKNPYEYLSAEKRENFFETKVTEYSRSEAVSGWDDF